MSNPITASIPIFLGLFTEPAQAQWLGPSWETHVVLIRQDLAMIRVLPQPVGTWCGFSVARAAHQQRRCRPSPIGYPL
jgi:hypothetical protein